MVSVLILHVWVSQRKDILRILKDFSSILNLEMNNSNHILNKKTQNETLDEIHKI